MSRSSDVLTARLLVSVDTWSLPPFELAHTTIERDQGHAPQHETNTRRGEALQSFDQRVAADRRES